MEPSNQLTPVYSYQRFKELADDRMVQIKVFIQTADSWTAAGSGALQFFQIDGKGGTREVREEGEFRAEPGNLFLLVEASSLRDLPAADLQALQRYREVFRTRETTNPEVIVFYDLYNGRDFEFDLERQLIRQGHRLGTRQRRQPPTRDFLHMGRYSLPDLGPPLRSLQLPCTNFGVANSGEFGVRPGSPCSKGQPDRGFIRQL